MLYNCCKWKIGKFSTAHSFPCSQAVSFLFSIKRIILVACSWLIGLLFIASSMYIYTTIKWAPTTMMVPMVDKNFLFQHYPMEFVTLVVDHFTCYKHHRLNHSMHVSAESCCLGCLTLWHLCWLVASKEIQLCKKSGAIEIQISIRVIAICGEDYVE